MQCSGRNTKRIQLRNVVRLRIEQYDGAERDSNNRGPYSLVSASFSIGFQVFNLILGDLRPSALAAAACCHHITQAAAFRGTAEAQISVFPGLKGQR
jgi:hypothetical protein